MKGKNTVMFFLIVVLIAGLAVIAINGLTIGKFSIEPVKDQLKLGLDIKGGVAVVFEAKTDETGAALSKTMNQTKNVISRRINELGLTEPVITLQGEKQIRIELPGVKDSQAAFDVIGKTALLEFVLVTGDQVAVEGADVSTIEYESILQGTDIKDAFFTQDEFNQPSVGLKFTDAGTELFKQGTQKAVNTPLGRAQVAIILDGKIISAPTADQVISNGSATITGKFTFDEANELALLIRGGALPVQLEEVKTSVIGATLGLDSFNSAVKAAAVGILLVMAFMSIYYRIPGLISSISLVLYAVIVVYVLIILNATLTLPGIAGIVISLGMAVDANVIIFERLKEEISNGKSLRASIESGFHRAMSTIVDSNVTTFIAALVLFAFGEGPIRGFAITLMIGIISSMFTAVIITKTLLKLSLGFTDRKKLYGSRG